MIRRWISVLSIVTVCLAGCGKSPAPLPATYPVHGKVTYRDGSPVTGGMVQFLPQSDISVVTTSAIARDGSYSLVTKRSGLHAAGAVAGLNRVTIMVNSPTEADSETTKVRGTGMSGVPPTTFPTPYIVEPHDNIFPLVVDRPLPPPSSR